jgi:hypothetical protein
MVRWRIGMFVVVCCLASAAAGYWFGFKEALTFGIAADFLPRGSIAAAQLEAVRAGKTENLVIALEYDVDNGLIWGHKLFDHPLRQVVGPVWGFDFYPEYEQYATRLANYRKVHPTLMKPDMFDEIPPGKEQYREEYRELAVGTRENIANINAMVKRYATE